MVGLLRNVYILRENKYLGMYFLSMSFIRLFLVSVLFISGLLGYFVNIGLYAIRIYVYRVEINNQRYVASYFYNYLLE